MGSRIIHGSTYFSAYALALLLLFSATCQAETLYVTDILHLGLNASANTDSKKVGTAISGSALTVLEKGKNYTKVRTKNGTTGWAKSAYLVADIPARIKAAELEKSNNTLSKQLTNLQQKFSALQDRSRQLQEQHDSSSAISQQKKQELEQLKEENHQYRERLSTLGNSVSITVLGASTLLCLIAGFVSGLAWIDYRSRKRHGGFRIY
jgi:SH3 domain protein